MIWKPPHGSSPKNIRSTASVRGVEAEVPRRVLGVRRGEERRPGGVGLRRRGCRPPPPRGIAFHGRQKSKWYLSFQQLIAASAPRSGSASRAGGRCRRASRPFRATRSRATSFQLRTGAALPPHGDVRLVGRADRAVRPGRALLTSLKSSAHCGAGERRRPAVRNCEELCMRNGFTPPTHGVGSRIGCRRRLMSGCQCPASEFGTHCDGPNRPSPSRARRSSRRPPRARRRSPAVLNGPSGIAPSEAAYVEWRACSESRLSGPGMGLSGHGRDDVVRARRRPRLRQRRPSRRFAPEAPLEQVRPVLLRLDRVDRVVHGALHHAHVDPKGRWGTAVRSRNRGRASSPRPGSSEPPHCRRSPLVVWPMR